MPKLDPATRADLGRRIATQIRINERSQRQQYFALHCRYCNWTSNGLTLEDAIASNKQHESAHSEKADLEAVALTDAEWDSFVHDHDCIPGTCACACGCHEPVTCKIAMPVCGACFTAVCKGKAGHNTPSAREE